MRLDLTILLPYLGFLAHGALLTVEACALALVGSVVLGATVAIARTASSSLARRLAEAYVDVFRNVPFIVQLFFFSVSSLSRFRAAPTRPTRSAPASSPSTTAFSKRPK